MSASGDIRGITDYLDTARKNNFASAKCFTRPDLELKISRDPRAPGFLRSNSEQPGSAAVPLPLPSLGGGRQMAIMSDIKKRTTESRMETRREEGPSPPAPPPGPSPSRSVNIEESEPKSRETNIVNNRENKIARIRSQPLVGITDIKSVGRGGEDSPVRSAAISL